VQGFLKQPSKSQGRTSLKGEGGAFLKEPIAKLERSLQGVQVPLYLSSLLYSLLVALHIYTSISNWFIPGRVLSRVMLTKNKTQFSYMLSFILVVK
jgi:hypothetical protein